MKRFAWTAIAASALFAVGFMPALAQTAMTKCEEGEGQVLEYDFAKNFFDGQITLESLHPLRLASSNCVPGHAGKTSFRGVDVPFENMSDAQKAIGAAQALISLGITEPAVIEQLIARVKVGINQVEERRRVSHKVSVFVTEVAENDKK